MITTAILDSCAVQQRDLNQSEFKAGIITNHQHFYQGGKLSGIAEIYERIGMC